MGCGTVHTFAGEVAREFGSLDFIGGACESFILARFRDCFLLNGTLRSVKAGSDGVCTTKMAKHAGTKVKTEEKYKVTTQTHLQVCMKNKVY